MTDADDVSAGELLLRDARERYEDPSQDLQALAEELGLNRFRLVAEAKRRGWKMRKSGKTATQSTRATIQRFKELLQNRLGLLEGQINALGDDVSAANTEREIRAVNTLVRTLEKVLELERKDRTHRFKKFKERRDLNDAERDELVQRIANLRRRPDGNGTGERDGAGGGEVSPLGLEKLGPT